MQTGEGERGERICPGQESRLAPPGSGVLQAKMLCNHSVHLGDLHIPPCSTAIEGGENGVVGALCSSRERCLPLFHQLLVHFGAWLRPQEPIIQPRALGIGWGRSLQPNALSCLGKQPSSQHQPQTATYQLEVQVQLSHPLSDGSSLSSDASIDNSSSS